jgi:hypothetical protein
LTPIIPEIMLKIGSAFELYILGFINAGIQKMTSSKKIVTYLDRCPVEKNFNIR